MLQGHGPVDDRFMRDVVEFLVAGLTGRRGARSRS
jgi:hypothetical protein